MFQLFKKEPLESGRSINNGAKAVDGKLERALNRVLAYVKACRYT